MGREPLVLLVAAMDTKGAEVLYMKECLEATGVQVRLMDGGILGESPIPVDYDRRRVARAGGMDLDDVRTLGHEGRAISAMAEGAAALALSVRDEIDGILGLGGSMGTTLCSAVMRAFPVGIPKVMITTMGSRDTSPFVGAKDICLLHSVVDLAGLNRVTRRILRNGALAAAGMVSGGPAVDQIDERPVVAFSTLGTTEACARRLRELLASRGWEDVTFHSNGAGGRALEEMVGDGFVDALIDLSLHEIADHRFGGDYDSGPDRGRAAGRAGLPLVLVPGNIDFLVGGAVEQAEKKFPGRAYHSHNPAITCIRTSREELVEMAGVAADLANTASGPAAVVVPLHGFSAFDHPEGGPLRDPGAVEAFVQALTPQLDSGVTLKLTSRHANDPEFADDLVEALEQIWRTQ